VGYQDFANVSTSLAAAINEHLEGWEAKVVCCIPHPFQYPLKHDLDYDQANQEEKDHMRTWVEQGVDVLIWANEGYPGRYYDCYHPSGLFRRTITFGQWDNIPRKLIFHAGHGFRSNHVLYNSLDQKTFDGQLVSPDLWRLALPQAVPLFGKVLEVDNKRVDRLWEQRRKQGQIIVCHSPTNYSLKGSSIIEAAVKGLGSQVEYRQIGGPYHKGQSLPHQQLQQERRLCHIYIDQVSMVGGLGMSSLEAMADGMIVICTVQMIPQILWRQDMSECPLVQAPAPTGDSTVDLSNLRLLLRNLVSLSMEELEVLGRSGARFVQERFSSSVMAQNFKEILAN